MRKLLVTTDSQNWFLVSRGAAAMTYLNIPPTSTHCNNHVSIPLLDTLPMLAIPYARVLQHL